MKHLPRVLTVILLLACATAGVFTAARTYDLWKAQSAGECPSAFLARELAKRLKASGKEGEDAVVFAESEGFTKTLAKEAVQRAYVKDYLIVNVVVTTGLTVAIIGHICNVFIGLIHSMRKKDTNA